MDDFAIAFDDPGVELVVILLVTAEHLDSLRHLVIRADLLTSGDNARQGANSDRYWPLMEAGGDIEAMVYCQPPPRLRPPILQFSLKGCMLYAWALGA